MRAFSPVLWLVFCFHLKPVSLLSKSHEDKCLTLIPESYDRHVAPQNKGQAANVFIQMEVLDLDEINEETMDFRLHAFIRAVWKDSRFSVNFSNLHEDCVKHIWNPDLMFEESKQIIETGQHSTYFVVRDEHFYLSQRYSFKVACMMNFQWYPFDTQHCVFTVAFMATGDSEAILKWSDDEQSPYRHTAPSILMTKEIDPLQFIIEVPKTYSTVKKFMFTNFTYLLANFTLARRLTGSVVNYYMPSALLVVVSWVTFWLKEDAASERVTLIMTALLTICTQGNQYKSELPPVNYITAMDIWFFACIFMLFATLLEFAFSYNVSRKKKMEISLKTKKEMSSEAGFKDCTGSENLKFEMEKPKETVEANLNSMTRLEILAYFVHTAELDSICKILFPSVFLTFNIIYWSYYYQCKTVAS